MKNVWKILKDVGIQFNDEIFFSNYNLIIGKNGSGKTRFLRTVEKIKKKDHYSDVITLFFSEISAFYNNKENDEIVNELVEIEDNIYTFDLLMKLKEISFCDFLKVIENDSGEFLVSIENISRIKSTQKNIATKVIKELNQSLQEFLERKIIIANNNVIIEKKDGRSLPYKEALSELSPGELMLFYLCVFLIILKNCTDRKLILILDEPELHLHPQALISIIKLLKNSTNISELWIATHSLFLVPLFEFENIVLIDHNSIIPRNGKLYDYLYDMLVGLENNDIFEFFKSIHSWQYYTFIVECFCHPESLYVTNSKDEQFLKFLNIVKSLKQKGTVNILDYGAGKCRIGQLLRLFANDELNSGSITYTAYEPYIEEEIKKELKEFNVCENLAKVEKVFKQYNVIVLMNVLHEIDILKWKEELWNIYNLMSDDGILIFLEVVSLRKGEQPYGNCGYLVLQDDEVKALFDDDCIMNYKNNDDEKSNCWIITKEQVGNIKPESIRESIVKLKQNSLYFLRSEYEKKIKIANSNKKEQSKIPARKYAFLSQQYINAKIALERLENFQKQERRFPR